MKHTSLHSKRGFTLLELSIVIVIIGLIVAGISAGQSLVDQAQVRGLISDSSELKVSINSFKLQYDALPGDMNNAHDYWDSDCDADADLCNGNGDNAITINTDVDGREVLRAWQHLTLAGIYPGTFPGTDSTNLATIGENIPEGSISASGYNLCNCSMNSFYGSNGRTMLFVGGSRTNSSLQSGPIPGMTAAKLANIDAKVDDGAPDTGSVSADRGTGATGNCITGGSLTSGDVYLLSDTTADCVAGFLF